MGRADTKKGGCSQNQRLASMASLNYSLVVHSRGMCRLSTTGLLQQRRLHPLAMFCRWGMGPSGGWGVKETLSPPSNQPLTSWVESVQCVKGFPTKNYRKNGRMEQNSELRPQIYVHQTTVQIVFPKLQPTPKAALRPPLHGRNWGLARVFRRRMSGMVLLRYPPGSKLVFEGGEGTHRRSAKSGLPAFPAILGVSFVKTNHTQQFDTPSRQ